MQLKAYFNMRS